MFLLRVYRVKEIINFSFFIINYLQFSNPDISILNFKLSAEHICLGQELEFSFDLQSNKSKNQKLAIDYILHYMKKNGKMQPKVFKLKEVDLKPNQKIDVSKMQKFESLTTRKHYSGEHRVEVMINGTSVVSQAFTLSVD